MKKDYGPKICIVCGKEYIPFRCDQRCCGTPECKKGLQRINQREYRARNYDRVLANNRRTMRARRDAEKRKMQQKNDTIIGEGYAERQIEATLKMVGRVRTEL